MKKWFLNFAVVLLAGIVAGTALGELVRIQVEKGDGIEAGYAGKVAEILDPWEEGVSRTRTTWEVEPEVHIYVVGGVTNSVTNWVRVEFDTVSEGIATGDYLLPEDVLTTDGTGVKEVILEF